MSSFFFGRLTDWVLRRRGAVAVLIVLLTAFFLWKMQDLQFDNSNEIWFSEGDPSLERINTFHKLFGNDDFVYLVFDADTLFSPESLRLLSDLVSDIRKKVPYLRDVTWLGNAERIEADAEGIVVFGFHRSGNVRRRVHAGTPAAGAGREELSGQPHFLGREDRGDAP